MPLLDSEEQQRLSAMVQELGVMLDHLEDDNASDSFAAGLIKSAVLSLQHLVENWNVY